MLGVAFSLLNYTWAEATCDLVRDVPAATAALMRYIRFRLHVYGHRMLVNISTRRRLVTFFVLA